MNRQDILEKIIEEQNKVVESLEQSVERYKIASDLDEESTHDPEDFSHQTEAKDMQLRYEKMLREAQQSMDFLINEKDENHEVVEEGALIETDDNYLFIGVSVPRFQAGRKEVVSLSTEAPIFESLKGKKVGETLQLGAQELIIKSIV